MDEKILKSLYDIKLAIEEMDNFFLKEDKTFSNYQKNILLRRAIERNLEIIGEATNRILKGNPDFDTAIFLVDDVLTKDCGCKGCYPLLTINQDFFTFRS